MVLTEGDNAIEVVAVDSGGTESTPTAVTIIADFTPPAAPEVTSDPPLVTDQTSATIEGIKDAGSTLFMDGAATTHAADSTTWSVEVPLTDGLNRFGFTAQDELGNESQALRLEIVKSLVAMTVDTPPSLTAERALAITGTRGESVEVFLNGSELVAAGAEGEWSC